MDSLILALLEESEPDATWAAEAMLRAFWNAVPLLWPLWLILGALFGGSIVVGIVKRIWLARSGIADIDKMSGATFERRLRMLFEREGFAVKIVGSRRGDYGGDLVISRDGKRTLVQAKRSKRSVGIRAVQEAVAACAKYKCERAMVATNSTFTRQAIELARVNDVELRDRGDLVHRLPRGVPGDRPIPVMRETPSLGSNSPAGMRLRSTPEVQRTTIAAGVCGACGKAVSDAVRDFCIERPERFGGVIYCYRHQRAARARTRS